ncbi:MAG: tRNA guanosine(34) transglycosylase Tgt [Candidatus Uhrbacteria bacterium]
MEMMYTKRAESNRSAARAGVLHLAHGDVQAPCFMPIATCGAVKHVTPQELRRAGAEIILSNTYHLALRPGTEYLEEHSGLHSFMQWSGPILTDSGGYQVFSLGAKSAARGGQRLVTITEDGVRFRSHIDGSTQMFTPESVVEHQKRIGSDIAMVLDVCPPQPCSARELADAVRQTTRWAERSIARAEQIDMRTPAGPHRGSGQKLFGIVQGGSDEALRRESAQALTGMPFDGYAIGGVAVGEEQARIREAIAMTAPLLPEDKPRYLMGLGTPADIVHAVRHGVDMFDCVLPTRDARHGRVYVWTHRGEFPDGEWYERFDIDRAAHRDMDSPLDEACPCPACRTFSRAYLRHLHHIGEPLAQRLLTIHNLTFYLELMQVIRASIEEGTL